MSCAIFRYPPALLVLFCAAIFANIAQAELPSEPGDSHILSPTWQDANFDLSERQILISGFEGQLPGGLGRVEAHTLRVPMTGTRGLEIEGLHLHIEGLARRTNFKAHTTPAASVLRQDFMDPLLRHLLEGRVKDLTITISLSAERPWNFHLNSVSWKVQQRERANRWVLELELAPAQSSSDLSLAMTLNLEFNPRDGRLSVELQHPTSSISCQKLLEFAPLAWTEPFAQLQLEGALAPWFEVSRSPGTSNPLELRLGGFDTEEHHCRVSHLEWQSRDVDWLNTAFIRAVHPNLLPPGVDVEVGPGTINFVPISELPAYVGAAMIYSEEHGFYEHQGINAALMARAMARNLSEGRLVAGGSTITQQLVKNLFLSRDKVLERKFQEAVLATRVWQRISKERILELYLNCIEFGPGVWGIGPAARHYFDKEARNLTIVEAIFLAAIKPQPLSGEWIRLGKLDLEESGLAATMGAIMTTMHRHGTLDGDELKTAREMRKDLVFRGEAKSLPQGR